MPGSIVKSRCSGVLARAPPIRDGTRRQQECAAADHAHKALREVHLPVGVKTLACWSNVA